MVSYLLQLYVRLHPKWHFPGDSQAAIANLSLLYIMNKNAGASGHVGVATCEKSGADIDGRIGAPPENGSSSCHSGISIKGILDIITSFKMSPQVSLQEKNS